MVRSLRNSPTSPTQKTIFLRFQQLYIHTDKVLSVQTNLPYEMDCCDKLCKQTLAVIAKELMLISNAR